MLRHFILICLLRSISARLACFILCAGKNTDPYLLYHSLVVQPSPGALCGFLISSLHVFLSNPSPFNQRSCLFLKHPQCCSHLASLSCPKSSNYFYRLDFMVYYGHLKSQVCFGWPMWPFWLHTGKEWRCWWPTSRSQRTSLLMDAPRSSSGTQER